MANIKEELKKMTFHDSSRKIFLANKTIEIKSGEVIEDPEENSDDKKDDFSEKEVNTNRSWKTGEVGFCPHCGKMSYTMNWAVLKDKDFTFDPEDDWLFGNWRHEEHFERNEKGEYIVYCSECGKELTGIPYKGLSKSSSYHYENWRIKCYNFIVEDDKLKVTIFFDTFYPNVKVGKLGITNYNFKVIFNLKTGQSYIMEVRETYGKKKRPKWVGGRRLINCTYAGTNMAHCMACKILVNKKVLYDIGKELLRVTGGKLEDLFNESAIKEIESGKNLADEFTNYNDSDRMKFSHLTIYNRFKKFDKQFFDSLEKWLNDSDYYWEKRKELAGKKRFLLKLSKMENEKELFDWLSKKYKIPNYKKLKKIIYKNPLAAVHFHLINKMGFNDYNIMLSILEENTPILFDFGKKLGSRISEDIVFDFLKDLIAKKGEPSARKIIFSKDYSYTYISDSANMYSTFKRHNLLTPDLLKGTMREIHDRLSCNYRKIGQQNLTIIYDENILNLNAQVNGYDFVLAKDTHELIDVGNSMGICVGSYGRRAAENKLIIVVMKENEKYVGCIELDALGKQMRQAKAKFNNVLQEKKAEALKKWVEEKEIEATCYDYRHIAEGNIEYDEDKIYRSTHNYAGYGMQNMWD